MRKTYRDLQAEMIAASLLANDEAKKSSKKYEPAYPSKEELAVKDRERKLLRGLKEFNINGVKVLALKEKNAIRKARKL